MIEKGRRGFIKDMLVAAAGFAILPPATTYDRVWKAKARIIIPSNLFDWFWYTEDGERHEVWEGRELIKSATVLDMPKAKD
jgi:hypothetical protein